MAALSAGAAEFIPGAPKGTRNSTEGGYEAPGRRTALPDDPFGALPDDPFAATAEDLFEGEEGIPEMGGAFPEVLEEEYAPHIPDDFRQQMPPEPDDDYDDLSDDEGLYALPPCPETYWAVWVGSLPPRTQPGHLYSAFRRYGSVINCVVKSQQSDCGVYSDLGFVNFWFEHEAAYAASAMDGQMLEEDSNSNLEPQPVRTRPPQEKSTPPALRPLWYEMCQREAALASGLHEGGDAGADGGGNGGPAAPPDLLQPEYYAALAAAEHQGPPVGGPGSWAAKAAKAAPPPSAASPQPPLVPRVPRGDGPEYLDDIEFFQGAVSLTRDAPGYFCNSLRHPSETFTMCKQLFERKGPPPPAMRGMNYEEQMLSVLQTGVAGDGRTPFISLRGIPLQYVRDALRVGLDDVRRTRSSGKLHVVVVCGVSGTDDRTEKHKHGSHTRKYALQDFVGGELLRDEDLLDRCGIRPPHVPLYTVADDGKQRYYGSFLVLCQS